MHDHALGMSRAGHTGSAAPHTSEILRARGLRATRARLLIMSALREVEHPTVEALHQATAADGIALTTVYRTLESLEDAGLVWAVYVPGVGRTYHLGNQAPHAHLMCRVCGRLADLDAVPADASTAWGVPADFTVEHVQLTVIGRCRRCGGGAA